MCSAHSMSPAREPIKADTARPGCDVSQTWIDRLAFQGQNAERAFVHAAQRLAADKPLQCFNPERKFSKRQGSLSPQAALAQTLEVLGRRVVGPVDDAKIL